MTPPAEGPAPVDTVAVRFAGVERHFGEVQAVAGVDLTIEAGELFTLLGPSGSGKTTCLRLLAGFDRPTAGRIHLDGRDVTDLPPYEREVNTVFQDYALFPHMSVAENVGYGLMVSGVPPAERARRVEEMLQLVQLAGFGARRPSQLSGGQRQRVALARALAREPRVLLLDEPLGALDLKLRREMQSELKALQQRVGITFLYVTHDQEEALAMSDRIAVFHQGRIEQVGRPEEIYDHPRTAFVAGFVGVSNLLPPELAARWTGERTLFTLRPERIRLGSPGEDPREGEIPAQGTIREAAFLGMFTRYAVDLDDGGALTVTRPNTERPNTERPNTEPGAAPLSPGARVGLRFRRDSLEKVE